MDLKSKETLTINRKLLEQISSLQKQVAELEDQIASRKDAEALLRRESDLYFFGTGIDVSHQKKTEETLGWKTALFEAQVNTSIDGILVIGKNHKRLLVNQRFIDLWNVPQSILDDENAWHLVDHTVEQTIYPQQTLEKIIYLYKNPDETSQDEIELKNGTVIDRYAAPVIGKDGQRYGRIWTFRDITERKRAEEALYDSEVKFRSLFETAVEGIFQTTPDGHFISANPALVKIFDYDSPYDFIKEITDIGKQHYLHSEDRNTFRNILEAKGVIKSFETQLRGKKGRIVWVSINARTVRNAHGDVICYEGTLEDITDRKISEQQLKDSEEALASLINATDETLLLIDSAGKILVANEVAAQRFGKKVDQLIGISQYDLFPPAVASLRKKVYDEVARTGNRKVFTDERGGRIVESFAYPVLDDTGQVPKIAIFAKDITERKKTEDSLIESENKFRSLAEKSIVGIYLVQNGIFRYVNERSAELTGYTISEMVDIMGPKDVIYPEDLPKVDENIRRRINGDIQSLQSEFRIITKTGEVRYVEVYSSRAIYKGKPSIIGTFLDITERKKAEENLKYLSMHDSLTGLYNRFFFEEELKRCGSGRFDPVGIVMCDLDGLKLVNDSLGHALGDHQIIAAAHLLRDQFRTSDIVARIGGDEFAVLLPQCSGQALEIIHNRLSTAMTNQFIPDTTIPLMMSTGYALGNGKDRPIEELLKEADENMYDEKNHHRQLLKHYFAGISNY